MNTKRKQFNLRDDINKIPGKQAVIDQYDTLQMELLEILERTQNGTELKKFLRKKLERITEVQTFYTIHGPICIDTYNPDHASKSATRKKISDLQRTLYAVRKMQSQRRR